MKYTGRYTHRVAISNNRLVAMDEKSVTFQWKDYADNNRQKRMKLDSVEFIRRLDACRKALKVKPPEHETTSDNRSPHWYDLVIKFLGIDPRICPVCKKGRMQMHRELCATSPPWMTAMNVA